VDKELHRIIEDVKLALEAMGVRISRMVLFGSYARGEADEHSDIDIAVISDDFKDMNLLERLEFIGTALAKARIMEPVEVRAYTEEEFASKGKGTFVGDEVKAKGVEIL